MEEQDGEAPHASNKDIPAKGLPQKKDGIKEVSLEEASEFLRIIQQSEFKVIEQLNKTPARVSLLELLMSSEPHRALLVKVLNEAHVAQDISVEGFGGLVNNITANNYLAFAEEEIPAEGRGHNKALHVSVKCMDHIVAKVLIDNGSSLNVMPKSTLEKLPFNASHLTPSSMVVRAFDDTRREVRGEIDLPVQIGPHTCQVTFQIMDINPPLQLPVGAPLDPLSGSCAFYTPPKAKIRSGGALGHRVRRGRYLGKLPILHALCGSRRRIVRIRFPVF